MKITSSNFEFLTETPGTKGNQVCSLTTEEAKKFCFIMRPIIECMSWKSKESQKIVKKCVKVIEQAYENASNEDCLDLPFNL